MFQYADNNINIYFNIIKQYNIYGRESRDKTRQKKRKRGSASSRIFLKLGGGETNVQIQEAHQIPVMIITKKNKLRHHMAQFLKTKNKQRIMKPDRGKTLHIGNIIVSCQ